MNSAVDDESSAQRLSCRVCGYTAEQSVYVVHEMMFGTRQPFDYFQCGQCGCLQIRKPPANIGDFYLSNYYSLKQDHAVFYRNKAKNFLNRLRDCAMLFIPGGERLPFIVKVPHIAASYLALRRVPGLSFDMRILDVGCGSGQLLYRMRNAGFKSLTGIDPFLPEDNNVYPGLSIMKRSLSEIDGKYDLILFNHSFEHVENPLQIAHEIADRLSDGGTAVLRIPVADSVAWEEYGVNWFQLDAPRHLYLHTKASMKVIAERAGLRLADLFYDSGPEQFILSERYWRGLSMTPNATQNDVKTEIFEVSPEEQRHYERRAQELNARQRGDQASFYFQKI